MAFGNMALQNFLIDLPTNRIVNPTNPTLGVRGDVFRFIEGETYSGTLTLTNSGQISDFSFKLGDEENDVALIAQSFSGNQYSLALGGSLIRNFLYQEGSKSVLLNLSIQQVSGAASINPLPVILVSNPSGNQGDSGGDFPEASGVYINQRFDELDISISEKVESSSLSDLVTQYATESLIKWIVKSSNYTAASFENIQANTFGGAWTLTLPLAPQVGDEINIEDASGSWSANNLIIGRNGQLLNGGTSNYTANVQYGKLSTVFVGGSVGWSVK